MTAASGAEALAKVEAERPDLVLLDVMMPGMSGYEVCRGSAPTGATGILPVVMVTALDPAEERIKGLEAGADDFLTKPINQPELLARVRSLLRIKQLYDTVEAQAAQLAELNRTLEQRVRDQVGPARAALGRLKRFFSPQLAELIVAGGADDPLKSHRREITVVFLDLRGFTAFAETAEPEEVMGVLREYHARDGHARHGARGHARALRRRRHDGLLQRPGRRAEPGRARRPHGARHAGPRRRARGRLAEARLRARLRRRASRRATPPSAPSASRAGGTTARSAP